MPLDASWVGHRVVVRYRLAATANDAPGTPGATDVLGTLIAYDATGLAVMTDAARPELVRVPHARVVAGKPVPPRESTLLRMSAERLESICDSGWPARTVESLGTWRLREAGGFTGRANSVLPVGDPGMPLAAALEQVVAFYAEQGLPPLLQVVVGSTLEAELAGQRWDVARHKEGALVQVASVAKARRAARSREQRPVEPVVIDDRLTDEWLRLYERTAGAPADAVRRVLAGPETVGLASVGSPLVAVGRGVVTGDWLGLAAVTVDPSRRRQGLARRIVDALLGWGAEQGARSAYLQTMPGNSAALGLYGPYGFVTHHRYRYWGPAEDR